MTKVWQAFDERGDEDISLLESLSAGDAGKNQDAHGDHDTASGREMQ